MAVYFLYATAPARGPTRESPGAHAPRGLVRGRDPPDPPGHGCRAGRRVRGPFHARTPQQPAGEHRPRLLSQQPSRVFRRGPARRGTAARIRRAPRAGRGRGVAAGAVRGGTALQQPPVPRRGVRTPPARRAARGRAGRFLHRGPGRQGARYLPPAPGGAAERRRAGPVGGPQLGPPRRRLPAALRHLRAAPAVRPGRRRVRHVPQRRRAVGGLPRPLRLRERANARPAPAPVEAGLLDFVFDRVARRRLDRETRSWYAQMYAEPNREGWDRTQAHLREMDRRMRERGGRLLVADWPVLLPDASADPLAPPTTPSRGPAWPRASPTTTCAPRCRDGRPSRCGCIRWTSTPTTWPTGSRPGASPPW